MKQTNVKKINNVPQTTKLTVKNFSQRRKITKKDHKK